MPVLAAGLSGTFSHMLVLLSPLMTCGQAPLVTLQAGLSPLNVLPVAEELYDAAQQGFTAIVHSVLAQRSTYQ